MMKGMIAVAVLVVLFASVPEFPLAKCLTWKLGETTQGKSNIQLAMRAPYPDNAVGKWCFKNRQVNISLKVKNHSGTVDIGPVHHKQTYIVQFSFSRCPYSKGWKNCVSELFPVTVWVSSGEEKTSTRKLDLSEKLFCLNNLYITVTNQNPGFIHLGRAEMELKLCP